MDMLPGPALMIARPFPSPPWGDQGLGSCFSVVPHVPISRLASLLISGGGEGMVAAGVSWADSGFCAGLSCAAAVAKITINRVKPDALMYTPRKWGSGKYN